MQQRRGTAIALVLAGCLGCGIRVGNVALGPPAAVTFGAPRVNTWTLAPTDAATVYSAPSWQDQTWPEGVALRTGRDASGAAWVTWLAFDLRDVERRDRIERAWLELVPSASSETQAAAGTLAVHVSDHGWEADSLTWDNAPAVMPRPVARQVAEPALGTLLLADAANGNIVRFDVSRAVDAALAHGLGTITFVLVPAEGDAARHDEWMGPASGESETRREFPPGPALRIQLSDAAD